MGSDRAGPPTFSVDVTTDDGWTTVAVAGELDLATADELSDAVRTGLASGAVRLDLRDVTFMDSAGVRALNTALRESAARGRELQVSDGLQPAVLQLLEMTGMLGLLPMEDGR
jgi:anti-sigma B factor antagonist